MNQSSYGCPGLRSLVFLPHKVPALVGMHEVCINSTTFSNRSQSIPLDLTLLVNIPTMKRERNDEAETHEKG
jgi:hypothetical protein